jgi:hypothetical protein
MGYKAASRYRKYGNREYPCGYGHIHDSKKEAFRCNELHVLQRAGIIKDLRFQVRYELIPAQYEQTGEVYKRGPRAGEPKRGRCIERECDYIADFVYKEGDKTIIEDTKGMRTAEYIIKRKLMRQKYCDSKTVFKEI